MSLQRRMVLVVTAVTTVALGSAFSVVSYVFNRQQQERLDAELRAVATEEARVAPSLGFSFTSRPGPSANDVGPLVKHGVIFDERAQVLAATHPFDKAPPERSSLPSSRGICFDFSWNRRHLRGVLVPIPDYPGRELLLAASRDDLDGDERFLNRAMLIAFLVALIWVVAVAHRGVGRLTREHGRIADVARRVAGGDLSARVASASSDAETRQLGRDIDEMIDTITQLLAARDRLVAHAAHELRAPLTNLYGELQQALRKERDAQGYHDAIARALPAARHLKELIEDLLLLTRIRGEQPEQQPVSLARCIEEVLGLVRAEAEGRGISFSFSPVEVFVGGRERDLTRLVRNLVENAVAHAPDRSTIELRLSPSEGLVRLAVLDEGPGVEEEDRPRIFEPFFRSRASRKNPERGAGLGLGIARDIARAHGGDVVLDPESRPGRTCFLVSLPVGVSPGSPRPRSRPPRA